MKKTTKIFGLLLTLFGLALVTGCTPITDTPYVPEETTYTVTIATDIANGTVTADKTSAKAGETINLTVTPADGYELDTLSVKNGDVAITVTNNQFTMPAGDVTVDATFTEIPENTPPVVDDTNDDDDDNGEGNQDSQSNPNPDPTPEDDTADDETSGEDPDVIPEESPEGDQPENDTTDEATDETPAEEPEETPAENPTDGTDETPSDTENGDSGDEPSSGDDNPDDEPESEETFVPGQNIIIKLDNEVDSVAMADLTNYYETITIDNLDSIEVYVPDTQTFTSFSEISSLDISFYYRLSNHYVEGNNLILEYSLIFID